MDLIVFKYELDQLTDENEVKRKIQQKVTQLSEAGYTDEEIIIIFQIEKITEAQGNVEMIKNHQAYVTMVKQILSGKK